MLRVLRATAARTSRASFAFSSTRNLSAAVILQTTKAAAERTLYPYLLPGDSFGFLRNLGSSSSPRHDAHPPSTSEPSTSFVAETNLDSAPEASGFVILEAHDDDGDEKLTNKQIIDNSCCESSSSSSRHDGHPPSTSQPSTSFLAETNLDSAPEASGFVIPEVHDDDGDEKLSNKQIIDDSSCESFSAACSASADVEEVNLDTKAADFEKDLELQEDATPRTDDTESPLSAGREIELSASDSAYTDDEGDLSAEPSKDSMSDFPAESEEECVIDMSKVPEDLKEMMEDSYVCDSAEEDYPSEGPIELLTLDEVKQVLEEVRARDVKIFSVQDRCEWTDLMVVATGISDRHVRGIADALVYKIKKKGSVESPLYPTIEGQVGGKWLVVDCGNIVIHVLNEESRAYYKIEDLWTGDLGPSTADEDFETMLSQAGLKDIVS